MDWETSQLTFNPNWCVHSVVQSGLLRHLKTVSNRSSVQAFSQDTVFNQLTAKHGRHTGGRVGLRTGGRDSRRTGTDPGHADLGPSRAPAKPHRWPQAP